jgi:predicted dithiol-disulfide oxidoreductase (DUF899 family)
MTDHRTGTREEWLAARLELLDAEKELTRRGDDVARRRRELPWVPVTADYRFDTEEGERSLADLFGGRSQLLVYHFMYGPGWSEGCPSCSSLADSFDGIRVHLEHHDVAFVVCSRGELPALLDYRRRMGWSVPWVSSGRSSFNFDYGVSFTSDSIDETSTYNFRALPDWLRDPANLPNESPGMSAFTLVDGEVFHTYSAYARGADAMWTMWQWLDRAPLGRNEGDMSWFRRHDQYEGAEATP